MDNSIYGEELTVQPTVVSEVNEKDTEQEKDAKFEEETFTEPIDEEAGNSEIENIVEDSEDDEFFEEEIIEEEEVAKQPEVAETKTVDPKIQPIIDEVVAKRLAEITKQKSEITEKLTAQKNQFNEVMSRTEKAIAAFKLEGESTEDALIRLAAEHEGISVDEYRKRETKEAEEKAVKERQRSEAKQAIFNRDLALIKSVHPELKINSVYELPKFNDFAKLMSTNLYTAVEAYEIVNAKELALAANKQKILNDSKQHLRSANPGAVASSQVPVTRTEIEMWRGAYPQLSQSDLIAKIRQSKKKN